MRHLYLFVTLFVFTIATITGCSTKFDTAAPYKNYTVVYGLLDEADTAHYIRIQKAFLSQTLSAYDMEKVSDSSFYPQLNVVMKAINANGSVVNTIQLTRVDLNKEGYQKDTGAFFTTPNYAYKFKNALNPAYSYTLVITNPATGVVDSATTTIVDESPASIFTCPYLDIAAYNPDFTHINSSFNVNGKVPSSVAYLQGVLRVQWVEINSQNNTRTKKYADWNFDNVTPTVNGGGGTTNGYALSTANYNFYNFLETAMQPAPQFVTRLIDSGVLTIYAANSDYYTYMLINQTLGTGITGSDIEPNYTNIKGPNVIGLFAGRGLRTGRIIYTKTTVDSVMANSAYKNLNIVGTTY